MVKSTVTSITPAQHADNHRHGGSDPLTGDVRIDPTPYDLAKGILPTTDGGWVTPVADLAAMTDHDATTHTSGGQTNVNDDQEVIKVDLGAVYEIQSVFISAMLQVDVAEDVTVTVATSDDDITYYDLGSLTSKILAWTKKSSLMTALYPARYVRVTLDGMNFPAQVQDVQIYSLRVM